MERIRSYVVEAQGIFAPYLVAVLAEAGLDVVHVGNSMDLQLMSHLAPDLLFVDLDYVDADPLESIRMTRFMLPHAVICVYTGDTRPAWAAACHLAGANCVLTKRADGEEIAMGVRRALTVGAYTDKRYETPESPTC
ncbi:response regulator [bacterium]|nr:MAG: response regulator [bacterium]